jgi:hypothetical protein
MSALIRRSTLTMNEDVHTSLNSGHHHRLTKTRHSNQANSTSANASQIARRNDASASQMALTVAMNAAAPSRNVSTGRRPSKKMTIKSQVSRPFALCFFTIINFLAAHVEKRQKLSFNETYDVETYDVEDKENAGDITVDLSPSQSTMLKKNVVVDLDVTAHGLGSKNSPTLFTPKRQRLFRNELGNRNPPGQARTIKLPSQKHNADFDFRSPK